MLVSASAPVIITTVIAPQYYGAVTFVPWIALVYVLPAHCDYVRAALYVEGRPAIDMWVNAIAAIVCLGLYVGLIPLWGCNGAIAATAAAFAVAAGIAWMAAARTRCYRMRRCLGIVAATLAAIGLCISAQGAALALQAAVGLFVTLGFPAAMYLGVLTARERSAARGIPGLIARRVPAF